jgi:hypothetical protein
MGASETTETTQVGREMSGDQFNSGDAQFESGDCVWRSQTVASCELREGEKESAVETGVFRPKARFMTAASAEEMHSRFRLRDEPSSLTAIQL